MGQQLNPDGRNPKVYNAKQQQATQKQQRQISGNTNLVRPGIGSGISFKTGGVVSGFTGSGEFTFFDIEPTIEGAWSVTASVKVGAILGFSSAGAFLPVLSGGEGGMEIDKPVPELAVVDSGEVFSGQLTMIADCGPGAAILFEFAAGFACTSSDITWRIAGVRFPRSN